MGNTWTERNISPFNAFLLARALRRAIWRHKYGIVGDARFMGVGELSSLQKFVARRLYVGASSTI